SCPDSRSRTFLAGFKIGEFHIVMLIRDPQKNFEALWETFNNRYPFFKLRNVDWKKQYETYRPRVRSKTSDDELFEILCRMLDPLDDGDVELKSAAGDSKQRYFTAEKKTRFHQQFPGRQVEQLFETTAKTLVANGFARPQETTAWMLHYCGSAAFG